MSNGTASSDDSMVLIPILATSTPPATDGSGTSADVTVEVDQSATSTTSATAKFAAVATPPAPVTNMVNILYVGVNIASLVENGDNGAATTNTISFARGDSQPGTDLLFPTGAKKSTRSLKIVLEDPTHPGSLVMIASGRSKQVPHTIDAKVPPKSK